jgi:SAM-dependent methyltransferase
MWEGKRDDGAAFNFLPGKTGHNRVVDAVDLGAIKDAEYDFVLSCHSLEHIANPIKALRNWRRVAPGHLVLVLPYYRDTFDHQRPVTPLGHMIADFERDIGEDDLTHVQEIVELSDLSRVDLLKGMPRSEAVAQVKKMSSENALHRSMHHHVFDERNTIALVQHCGYRVLSSLVNAGSVFVLAISTEKL